MNAGHFWILRAATASRKLAATLDYPGGVMTQVASFQALEWRTPNPALKKARQFYCRASFFGRTGLLAVTRPARCRAIV
jgi:hypothetical protein